MTPPTGGGANRGGVGGEGDFGFVICDFILGDGYVSGVGGPRTNTYGIKLRRKKTPSKTGG